MPQSPSHCHRGLNTSKLASTCGSKVGNGANRLRASPSPSASFSSVGEESGGSVPTSFTRNGDLTCTMRDLVAEYGIDAVQQSLDGLRKDFRGCKTKSTGPAYVDVDDEESEAAPAAAATAKAHSDSNVGSATTDCTAVLDPFDHLKRYSREDLAPFDRLKHPVWVFDFDNMVMWWANSAAVALWNAESLEALLARDFTDMSQATKTRLTSYLETIRNGGTETEQWTIRPMGEPVTLDVHIRGIHGEDGRMLMLKEGDMPRPKEEIDQTALRRVEILRHLPLAVVQFDHTGEVMEQNPKASAVFGGTNSTGPSLVERFVSNEQGEGFLKNFFLADDYCCSEALLHTINKEERWFALKAGKQKDPVTSETAILFSAQDITDLRKAQEEADRTAMEKSELFAVLAHEIRTPLHQVVGFSEVLIQSGLNKQQEEYVLFLESSAKSLMTVINDSLDYTKMAAGEMKLENIPFEIQELITGVASALSSKANAKGLTILRNMSKEVPNQVLGDPTRLRQILLNLGHNAFKFTEEGTISFDVRRLEDDSDNRCWLRFEVRDSGIGIREDKIDRIFRKYQQAGASTARNYGGTGLGLAICDSLVKTMDGRLGVESVWGKGSTFWFELPFERDGTFRRRRSTIEEDFEPLGLNILVVEDNKVNQKLACNMLKNLGHHTSVADHGVEALQKIEQSCYDLVLMDVQMPVMDGLMATKKIREDFDAFTLPVIGLTADYRHSDLPKYVEEIGMNDCVGKPVRLKELKKTIRTVLEECKRDKD